MATIGQQASRPLRYGMVGGGEGAFIGGVHRKGAEYDGLCRLAAGCFSRDFANTLRTGRRLGIEPERLYGSYEDMAKQEALLEDGIEFVVVVTRNASHFAVCKAFLQQGIHVMCDKPLTISLQEARELQNLAKKNHVLIGVSYAYSGYPMVKQARELIRHGHIGDVRTVMAEYLQEGIANPQRRTNNWRLSPEQQGPSFAVADIGCHIEHTVKYMTGLEIASVCAGFDRHEETGPLETHANILVRFKGGASGVYSCSKLAIGYKNGLQVRIFGTTGSLEWNQEYPEELRVAKLGQPQQLWCRGRDALYPAAASFNRLPGGHPEGLYESFANLYSSFAKALISLNQGSIDRFVPTDFPCIEDGVAGVEFISHCVESAAKHGEWVSF